MFSLTTTSLRKAIESFAIRTNAKDALQHGRRRLTFVTGNESCDLDSAVCSVVYAAYLREKENCNSATNADSTTNIINNQSDSKSVPTNLCWPVLNIPRADFALRTEVKHCFAKAGIDDTAVIFRDDPILTQWFIGQHANPSTTNIVLVDHHVPVDIWSEHTDCITTIIDHRERNEDALRKLMIPKSCSIQIEHVGSCATLVAETLLANDSVILKNRNVIELLLGAILVDTANLCGISGPMSPKDIRMAEELEKQLKNLSKHMQQLVTARDVHAAENLEKKATECQQSALPSYDRTALFDEIIAAKEDISKLSFAQILQKDMKIIPFTLQNTDDTAAAIRILFSTVPGNLQELRSKADFSDHTVQSLTERFNVDAVFIIGVKFDRKVTKGKSQKVQEENQQQSAGENKSDDTQSCTKQICIISREEKKELPKIITEYCLSKESELKLAKEKDEQETSGNHQSFSTADKAKVGNFIIYRQQNTKISRKQLIPKLAAFLRQQQL